MSTLRLEGKVALVTGGAHGQGEATSRRFVAEGASVFVTDIDDDAGKQLVDELGEAATYLHLDAGDEDGWRQVMDRIEADAGRLDVLVNNAGILTFGAIEDLSLAEYRKVIEVNQIGTFLGLKSATPLMKRSGRGSVINVSSVEGLGGMPGTLAYASTKFAVRGMTKVAALELGPDGIRVNSIHPGAIDTAMLRRAGSGGEEEVDMSWLGQTVALMRTGTAEDVANLNLFLASDESSYCTGAEFVIDGGSTATSGFGWKPSRRQHGH